MNRILQDILITRVDGLMGFPEAKLELAKFSEKWHDKYPQIAKSWESNWNNIRTIFDYSADIRKAIYTANAIESLNIVIRKTSKRRKIFPTDESAFKVVYLAIEQTSKKWTTPIRNWCAALNRFSIEFGNRITDYI